MTTPRGPKGEKRPADMIGNSIQPRPFLNRTPGPPPFSAINSMPASSRAARIAETVVSRDLHFSFSKFWIVIIHTEARAARLGWLHLRRPRAARH